MARKHSKAYEEYARLYRTARDYAKRYGLKIDAPAPSKVQGRITKTDIGRLHRQHKENKDYRAEHKLKKVKERYSPDETSIILENLYSIPDAMAGTHPNSANFLRTFIDREIGKRGKEEVARVLTDADEELIAQCAVVIYYAPHSDSGADALTTLVSIFCEGEILSAEEMKEISEQVDKDIYVELPDPWDEE